LPAPVVLTVVGVVDGIGKGRGVHEHPRPVPRKVHARQRRGGGGDADDAEADDDDDVGSLAMATGGTFAGGRGADDGWAACAATAER
jgi:hypothetical protein